MNMENFEVFYYNQRLNNISINDQKSEYDAKVIASRITGFPEESLIIRKHQNIDPSKIIVTN